MPLYPDISHYHPVTDWTKIKASCPFLICKATQGTTYVDSTLTSFINGCESNQIPYWLYAYLNAGGELTQAKFLVSTCKDKVGSYFVGYILDVEAGNTAANVQSALDFLNGLGVKTMIYHMYSQYSKYKSIITSRPSQCAWWEARYGVNNGVYNTASPAHTGADLHQYTSKGSCAGISGVCDLNRLTGTKSEDWFKTPLSTSASEGNTTYCGTGVGTAVAKMTMTIRSQSSTSGKSYGTIAKGTAVEVLEVLSNGWYKIVWPGASCGYAYTSNVSGKYYTYTTNGSAKVNTASEAVSYSVGDKVVVNGKIYANGNGGTAISKLNSTMYVVELVSSSKYKYYIGLAAKKGGTRQGWASPDVLTKA